MKTTILIIACMMAASCAFGAEKTPTPKKTSLTESELRTMAKAAPTVTDADALYCVGMATNSVERQQEYYRASAACLLACGKRDLYDKHLKGKLVNVAAFEDSLKDKCGPCAGTGRKDRRCYVCSGKGKCSSCKGSGRTVSMGFDRPNGTKPCHKCGGSGRCQKCGSGGSTKEKCASCNGTGKVFRQIVAERVFRDACTAIADRPAAEAGAGAKTKEMPQRRVLDGGDEVRRAKEEFAKRCNGSGDAIQVDYQGTSFSISGANFVVFKQDYLSRAVSLVVPRSPTLWYNAVEKCADKLKEWVRVAKKNKVKDVEKIIPHGYMDVDGYPNKITAGRGQDELFRKAVRTSYHYSSFFPEQIQFVGAVKAYDDDFKHFGVSLTMVCGKYLNSQIFYGHGTIEKIDKELVKFLVFSNPKFLEEAHCRQAEKEALFR